jgi:hypothetical protein
MATNPSNLTPEQIRLLQQQNDLYRKQLELQAEGYSLSTSYLESLKEVMDIRSRTSVSDGNILDINKKINRAIAEQKGIYDTSSDVQKQILKNKKLIHQASVQELSLSSQLSDDDKKRLEYSNKNISTINKKMKLLDEEKAKNSSLQDKDLIKRLQTEISQKERGLSLHTKSMSQASRTLLYTQKQREELEKQNVLREGEVVRLKRIEKILGTTGALIKGIGKIPIIGNLVDTNKALKEMEKTIAGGGGKWAAMGAGLKSIGKDIFTHLTDPLSIVIFAAKSFWDILVGADKSIGDLAKGMNITYTQAGNLRRELSSAVLATKDEFVTTQGLQDSLLAINATLGTNARISNETLISFTKLREKAGYTNEELAEFQRLTSVIGGDLEGNVAKFAGTVELMNAQNKLSINEKQLLKDISKTSDAIKLSVGGTVEKIAKAAFQAKQFGINLQQADQISHSLLDFESSIQNELEAELLTGKDLNLEKARLLALNGDIAGASAEILKQVKGSAEFGNMNRIQQEAIAKAVGMSRDDLAKSLVDREALVKLGGQEGTAQERYNQLKKEGKSEAEIAAMLGSESLARQYEQNSVAEELNMMIQQLKEQFIPIAEELLPKIQEFLKDGIAPIIEKIGVFVGKIVGNFGALWTTIKLIGAFMAGKLAYSFTIMAAQSLATLKATIATGAAQSTNLAKESAITVEKSAQAVGAVVTAEASSLGTATPFIIGGIAAVMAAAGAYYALSDGHIGSDGGLIVSGKKGTYQLDPNDSVIAGTDLNKKSTGGGGGGSASVDMYSVVAELQNVRSVLNQILTKEGTVNMDTTRVGTTTNIGTYKVQ